MENSLAPIRFILLLGAAAAAAADILPGSTLFASDPNSTWPSPNNTFTLSFFQDDPGNPNSFFAGIRYDARIPIWKAGGDSGSVSSSASLRFLPNGDLQLTYGGGSSPTVVVWSSNTAGRGVSSARLDDSGNLVLRNATAPNIWSTFDNPTDTIVPSQNFTLNNTLKSGKFSFKLRQNGNLTLLWNNSITYYNSGFNSSADFELNSPSLSMNPVGILSLFDPSLPNPLKLVYSSDYSDEGDILRFVKLDDDGNLRIYSYNKKGSRNPILRWSALSDQCRVFGYCGNFGICSYNDSGPICSCPSENFAPVDPEDLRQGCRRKVELGSCSSNQSILQMDHSVFLTYDPELSSQQTISAGISACRQTCLVSAACIASTALADGTGFCYQKLPNFVSGYRSLTLPSTSFVKVCGTPLPYPSHDDSEKKKKSGSELPGWVVGVAVAGSILGLILFQAGLWLWCFRNRPRFSPLPDQLALLEYASGTPVQFSYRDLHRATGGFKEKLGDGGFGAVYRGVLRANNRTIVAVKQLEGIEQGEKQFRMEVATISSTHHLNLVRLIGFCSEGRRHRLLVYEFMKNGSLDLFLFSGKFLKWEQRYVIALGTARAMTYLHEECRDCIVHCDIKPENILLDDNYNAKVSDFGLAKLVNPKDDRHRTLTSIRGTRGYLAPECLANLPITSKSDVYSFGMVLLEIVSGKRNFHVSTETNGKKFSTWAYEEYEKGNASAILDKSLGAHEIDMDQVMRAIEVSFWCIQEQISQRPKMGKVVQMLEGVCHFDRPPSPRAPTDRNSVNMASSSTSSSRSGQNLERASSSLLHAD
ncbi:hypothetical protein DM860_009565 [Cuscuta australis]|uniref:Receptor-like serine/threonine-protein kinase n=1 Tax=Cuscuta australis TaxID=267555 RepID=A0A328DNC8_9ASTE|nr:hypothetical protein DM860_009565 [Cuscuta australis]